LSCEAERDLANGQTVTDVSRKHEITESTNYRWGEQHGPDQVTAERYWRELEVRVDRLKTLVAALLLKKQMLPDVAKKVSPGRCSEPLRIICRKSAYSLNGGHAG
jgi:transposase-like protein